MISEPEICGGNRNGGVGSGCWQKATCKKNTARIILFCGFGNFRKVRKHDRVDKRRKTETDTDSKQTTRQTVKGTDRQKDKERTEKRQKAS